jgi:hypothetical protein
MRLGSSTTPHRGRPNWWPGSIQSKRSSRQCSLQGKWWLLFSGMFTEFFWLISHGSTINAAAYEETRETQGGYSAQETRIVDQRTRSSSFARLLDLTVLPQPWISWAPGAGKFFHIHHTVLIWHRWTSIYSQKWKSTSEVSVSTPARMFKMKSRNGYVPRTYFFLWRTVGSG